MAFIDLFLSGAGIARSVLRFGQSDDQTIQRIIKGDLAGEAGRGAQISH
jgi:hypothetical protein